MNCKIKKNLGHT